MEPVQLRLARDRMHLSVSEEREAVRYQFIYRPAMNYMYWAIVIIAHSNLNLLRFAGDEGT